MCDNEKLKSSEEFKPGFDLWVRRSPGEGKG